MMGAVWIRARSEMRARWRAWLAVALLLGIFGGVTAAAVAGGRRTSSAYDRFLESARTFDVFTADFSIFLPIFWKTDFAALEALPYVERTAHARYFFADQHQILAPVDDAFGTAINRRKILVGRLPRGVDEVSIPFSYEPPPAIDVGDEVTVRFEGRPEPLMLKVVGRHVMPGDFPPRDLLGGSLVASPAFAERYGESLPSIPSVFISFRNGARDIPKFDDDHRKLSGGKVVNVLRNEDQARNVRRSFRLQAVALWLLAGALGIGAALVIGQTIAREISLGADDVPTLRALGMSRTQVTMVALLQVGLAAIVGAVVAVVFSWLASSAFPRGLARVAEPSPGLRFDPLVAVGTVGVILPLVTAASMLALLVEARRSGARASVKLSSSAILASRVGMSPSALAGIRFALEPGGGRAAVPVRSTIAAVTIGVVALTSAWTFGANLDHLLATPRLYGLGWHISYGFGGPESAVPPSAVERARTDGRVAAAAAGTIGLPMEVGPVGGRRIPLAGAAIDPIVGAVVPHPQRGTFPRSGEVLLGPRTAERIGARVGGAVEVAIQGGVPARFVVAGIGVLPPVAETAQLGDGLLMSYREISLVGPPGEGVPKPDTLFVRFREGLDVAASIESFRTGLENVDEDFDNPRATDLVNFGRVQNMPVILAGLLATLAVAALVHLLLTAIRRRRRDLAVLKTIGFRRGQARAAVAWQASTTAIVALLIGLPAGVAGGRLLWAAFAEQLGVLVELVTPWSVVLLTIPVGLIIANLVALLPGRAAARTHPAVVFRTE